MLRSGFLLALLAPATSACATGFESVADGSATGAADSGAIPDRAPISDTASIADADRPFDGGPEDDADGQDAGAEPSSCALAGALPSASGSYEQHTYAGPEGTRDYWLYVPSSYDGSPRPLVVMIHGCVQTAAQVGAATRYDRVAEAAGALLLLPEQSLLSNGMRCWNWFAPADQQRGQGEPALLTAMVDAVASSWSVDPARTFVGGFSAGASMALVMAATYPDRFAAVASFAGCPYQGGCLGTDSGSALVEALLAAMGSHGRAVPIFVASGSSDTLVSPVANDAVIAQWLGAADLLDDGAANQSVAAAPSEVVEASENGLAYERRLYAGGGGTTLAERWVVDGLGHAWCGGSDQETYSTGVGPNLSRETYRFFCENPLVIP